MSTTTPQFGPDFVKELVPWMLERMRDGKGFPYVLDIGMTYLLEHWVAVISFLFAVLVYAIIRALMGHWWILGSVLYKLLLLYCTLFLIGLIFGPEIFANDYFKIVLFLVYITCYILVGKILKKTGLRR
jgi:hypothetical protein